MSVYQGKCFCGAVEITVTGEAVGAGYCHCASCRSWSAGPVNAFTLWKPEAVKVTKGADNLGVFHKTGRSYRKWCKTCGGHLLTDHTYFDGENTAFRALPRPASDTSGAP